MISLRTSITPKEQVEFFQACGDRKSSTKDVLAGFIRGYILRWKVECRTKEDLKINEV